MVKRYGEQDASTYEIGRREINRLVATYSIRVREFSEAVAILGQHVVAGSQFHEALTEIERLRALYEKAEDDFLGAIDHRPSAVRVLELKREAACTEIRTDRTAC